MAWIVLESIVVRIVCRIVWRICRFVLLVWIISMLVSWIISLIVSRVWMVTWPWTRILVSPLDLIFIFVLLTLTFSFWTTLSTISKGRVPFILIHLSRAPGPCIWVYVRAVVIHFPSVNEGKFARKSFFCMALTWKWWTMLTCHNHNIVLSPYFLDNPFHSIQSLCTSDIDPLAWRTRLLRLNLCQCNGCSVSFDKWMETCREFLLLFGIDLTIITYDVQFQRETNK